ncbi:2'-5' RNA ligase family protein [Massilia sp. LjRoot122]|uniref:2'-5' RNA ligase family protein n=1 Tax=Massilia sp. LjRoot122 TaxID=3342257 RepID=UPI003ECC3317
MTSNSPASPDLHAHYAAMWERAHGAIGAGDVDRDERLAAGPDTRRGLTLIARPGAALAARFDTLLDRLAAAEPDQYRHPPADMHLTVLSLFTATEDPAAQLARLEEYRAAVHAALDGMAAFEIDFDGIALSRGAVLARGIPRGPALEGLRERLRGELLARGLAGTLDQRYRLVTAHATLFRFAAPLRQPSRFAALLAELRDAPLGSMRVDQLELVINDWYMSSAQLERVEVLRLPEPSPRS